MQPRQFVVTSIEEYVALPELKIGAVPDEKANSVRYTVHKVGFFPAAAADCARHKIEADVEPRSGKCLLPTAVVAKGKEKQFVRLPLSLAEWAAGAVSTAQAGANPFPCEVEFGVLRDRHYAEIL